MYTIDACMQINTPQLNTQRCTNLGQLLSKSLVRGQNHSYVSGAEQVQAVHGRNRPKPRVSRLFKIVQAPLHTVFSIQASTSLSYGVHQHEI